MRVFDTQLFLTWYNDHIFKKFPQWHPLSDQNFDYALYNFLSTKL